MKIVFSPSGKRMIPYPPVAPAILAAALDEINYIGVKVIDLEMELWKAHNERGDALLYTEGIDGKQLINGDIDTKSQKYVQFQNQLSLLIDYRAAEPVAISVMGFEQLASAILLALRCIEKGSYVIMGGQYWQEKGAKEVLNYFKSHRLTVVIGDGWEAIKSWCQNFDSVPPNGIKWINGEFLTGTVSTKASTPPRPNYATVNWFPYHLYAKEIYKDNRHIKRGHLYVWDKQCPYKCNFCRVSSGSKAKLAPAEDAARDFEKMLKAGFRQFNFMTNELNPNLHYLRKFISHLMPIIDKQNMDDIAWFTYLRPDFIGSEDLVSLRKLGCRLVRYGVETGSQELSDKMQKDYTIGVVEQVLRDASAADIMNHVNFLIGYPGETERHFVETLDFVDRNYEHIHSVRINPFYLPPGTPMAKTPEKYGINLIAFSGGYWEFETEDGNLASKDVVEDRINRLTRKLKEKGVGFSAVLPFVTLNELSKYETRDLAIANMKKSHPFMWEYSSPDMLKSILGGYTSNGDWSNTIYKRGRNYQLSLCND